MPNTQPDMIEQFLLDLPTDDRQSRRDAIYQHLIETHQPGSFYETLRLQEMAVAWLEISDLRSRVDSLRSFLRAHASDRFETATRKHYEQLGRDLLKSRGGNQKALAAHTFGARLLAREWEFFRYRLSGGGWIDHLAICKILVSEGFSDRIENLEGKPFWIVARFLKLFKAPGPIIADWIKHCRIREAEGSPYFSRVMSEISNIESAEIATHDLEALCEQRIQFWNEKAAKLSADHEKAKEAFCDGFTAYPGVATSIRTLISLQKIQFARIAKLEKELRALKREAEKDEERRQKHQARLEAIRNGTTLPRSRRKPAETSPNTTPDATDEMPVAIEMAEIADNVFPYINATSVQENESVAGAGEQPADSFPERELVETVQRTAEEFNQTPVTEADAPTELTSTQADSTNGQSVREQEYRKIISRMSDEHLANPQQNDLFFQLYGKSSRSRRKLLHRLLTEERTMRSITRIFQPSG